MIKIIVPTNPDDIDCYFMDCLAEEPENIPYTLVKSDNSDWRGYLVLDESLHDFS